MTPRERERGSRKDMQKERQRVQWIRTKAQKDSKGAWGEFKRSPKTQKGAHANPTRGIEKKSNGGASVFYVQIIPKGTLKESKGVQGKFSGAQKEFKRMS